MAGELVWGGAVTEAAYQPSRGVGAKLRRRWAWLAARRPRALRPQRAAISFTFDDFPKSAAVIGAQILEAHGVRGTYYCAAGFEGGSNHLGKLFEACDVRRLAAIGHEIGCHTFSHLNCSRASPAMVLAEVERNAQAIARMGHREPLRSFAFPFGDADAGSKRALAGRFETLRSVWPGVNHHPVDCALLRAAGIEGGEAGVARALDLIAHTERVGGWLVLYTHDVQEGAGAWGCTPEAFASVVAGAARARGVAVLPIAEAAAYVLEEAAA